MKIVWLSSLLLRYRGRLAPLKLICLLLFVVLVLVHFAFLKPEVEGSYTHRVMVNGRALFLEIADTPDKREQGLSHRKQMNRDQGMLFLFEMADQHTFWMKDTRMPLDIIWLREGKVVDLVTLPPPEPLQMPAIHTPQQSADRVLELNAGMATEYGIERGKVFPELTQVFE
jgi:uncharacterized membrane protein (UPF0127 family)